MGSGCGALNFLANAVRVLACVIQSHFAVEKATKQMMNQNMMVIQLGEILRLPFIVSLINLKNGIGNLRDHP